jgi:ligand-binding sensor domain-containing protein/signal transduction histidine kinase
LLCRIGTAQQLIYHSGLHPAKNISQYSADVWTTDNGLPNNSLSDIIQSYNGYLWITSLSGLVRFDGVTFTNYNRDNFPDMPSSTFLCLTQARDSSLWIGSSKGIIRFKDDKVLDVFMSKGENAAVIEIIRQDKYGNMWVGLREKGIACLNTKGKNITLKNLPAVLQTATVLAIHETRAKGIWIGTQGQGVFQYENGVFKEIMSPKDYKDLNIAAIAECNDGRILLSTTEGNLYTYSNEKFTQRTVRLTKDSIVPKDLNKIYEDQNGTIWIASVNGLIRLTKNNEFQLFTEQQGLSNNLVQNFCEDKEGCFWIATWRGGLTKLKDSKFTNFTSHEGLSNDVVNSICEDKHRQGYWIGTDNGLNFFANDQFTVYNTANGLIGNRIRSVFTDNKHTVWVLTYEGISTIDHKGKITNYTTANGLHGNATRVGLQDTQGTIWIGTKNGLHFYKNKKFGLLTKQDGLQSNFISALFEDNRGRLWIGSTGSGVSIYNLYTQQFESFPQQKIIAEETIFCFFQDRDNHIWIGTANGIFKLYENTYHHYTTKHGLLHDDVFQIIEDVKGEIWLTTNVGICRVHRKDFYDLDKGLVDKLNITTYSKDDGLKSSQATPLANAFRASDGKLWFPMLKGGIAVFPPESEVINTYKPPVLIQGLVVDNHHINIHQTITLPAHQHRFIFSYTALSFVNPKKVRFKYKLAPFDTEWQEAEIGSRIAQYTNLDNGEYEFKVIACNNDGVWNEEGASLKFTILPPFWETTWFKIVVVLSCIAFGIVFYQIRVYQIKAHNKELALLVAERTKELVVKNQELEQQKEEIEQQSENLLNQSRIIDEQNEQLRKINTDLEQKVQERTVELSKAYLELLHAHEDLDNFVYRAAHDLKGPLMRLLGLCQVGQLEIEDNTSLYYFQLLLQNAQELDATLSRLLIADKIKKHSVNFAFINLKTELQDIIHSLRNVAGFNDVEIILEVPDRQYVYTDAFLLNTILQNLIKNSIDYRKLTPQQASFILIRSFIREQTTLLIEIVDNGIGIQEEAQAHIFEMFYRGSEQSKGSGLGLYVADIAAKRMNGNLRLVQSNHNGDTIFELRLPLEQHLA